MTFLEMLEILKARPSDTKEIRTGTSKYYKKLWDFDKKTIN